MWKKLFDKKLVSETIRCQILTPTNMAASVYNSARTIHSFFHGALDDLSEGYDNPKNLMIDSYAVIWNKLYKKSRTKRKRL